MIYRPNDLRTMTLRRSRQCLLASLLLLCVAAMVPTTPAEASSSCKPVHANTVARYTPSSLNGVTCLQTIESMPVGTALNVVHTWEIEGVPDSQIQGVTYQRPVLQEDGSVCPAGGYDLCITTTPGPVRVNLEVSGTTGGTMIPTVLGIQEREKCTTVAGSLLSSTHPITFHGLSNGKQCFDIEAEAGASYATLGVGDTSAWSGSGDTRSVEFVTERPANFAAGCTLGVAMACFTAKESGTYNVRPIWRETCEGSAIGCASERKLELSKIPTTCPDAIVATNPGKARTPIRLGARDGVVHCRKLTNVGAGNWLDVKVQSAGTARVAIADPQEPWLEPCSSLVTDVKALSKSSTCKLRGTGPWYVYTVGETTVTVSRRSTVPPSTWAYQGGDVTSWFIYWLSYMWSNIWFPAPAPLNVDYAAPGVPVPALKASAATSVPIAMTCPSNGGCDVNVELKDAITGAAVGSANTRLATGRNVDTLPVVLDTNEVKRLSAAKKVVVTIKVDGGPNGSLQRSITMPTTR